MIRCSVTARWTCRSVGLDVSQVEEVLHGIYEAINTGNLALLDKFVAPGYVEHSEGFQGVEPFRQ